MAADKKFGWCFIGTGSLAKTVAKQLLLSGRHEIVSCYTRNPHRGEQFANNFGCDFYETAESRAASFPLGPQATLCIF